MNPILGNFVFLHNLCRTPAHVKRPRSPRVPNVLYTEDWRTILIDHSRSFRSSKKFTERLVSGKNALGNRPLFIRELPRFFVEKIRALDSSSIRNAVGPTLDKKEIEAVLIRKKLLLDEIDASIKELGEDNFLY